MSRIAAALVFVVSAAQAMAAHQIAGRVLDPQGQPVAGASVAVCGTTTATDERGAFAVHVETAGCTVTVEAAGFERVTKLASDTPMELRFDKLSGDRESMTVSASAGQTVDFRSAIFTRDDQVFQQLESGIDAGQHEGGGKSLEIRRFGFNLDHGGVNGGLKVLVDDVQQNQGTQGHGQGYLGALKAVSPELIQDVTITNGPFSAEYGDFSGLGVVHIRQRESLPDEVTVRLEGGDFDTRRGFFAYSPVLPKADAYLAYDGSYTDGPFRNPGRYRRDNINGNYTRRLNESEKLGFRVLYGRNNFDSSGQLPLDLVSSGQLDRFGFIDPTDGGRVQLGTLSSSFSKALAGGGSFKADGFLSRSLFDLYSNFTFYLRDPLYGDAFQQHDSRLQQGLNTQYTHVHHFGSMTALLVAGANFHDNQINVGLYPRQGRTPTGVAARAQARVANGAGYGQETLSAWSGRLLFGGGVRFDEFRFDVEDRVSPARSGILPAGRWQGKGSLAVTPFRVVPLALHVNYGRGINSSDARAVVQMPDQPRVATTDFYQLGTSSNFGRASLVTDLFWIDHSHEQVYIPDDGSFEFKGPSRAYGYETKLSVSLSRRVSLNGGLTKIGKAFFRGGERRLYVDSAPHFVANAALTVAAWHGWNGSLRMRAINHYRLDGANPSIVASGHTVFDLGVSRQIRRGVELSVALDNLTNRDYYETQNYFESRVAPSAPAVARIHGTPGYPLTAMAGITFRLKGK